MRIISKDDKDIIRLLPIDMLLRDQTQHTVLQNLTDFYCQQQVVPPVLHRLCYHFSSSAASNCCRRQNKTKMGEEGHERQESVLLFVSDLTK